MMLTGRIKAPVGHWILKPPQADAVVCKCCCFLGPCYRFTVDKACRCIYIAIDQRAVLLNVGWSYKQNCRTLNVIR